MDESRRHEDILNAALAKGALLDVDAYDLMVIEWQYGSLNKFHTMLFNLYQKADMINKIKFRLAWPDEARALDKFRNNSNYYRELEKKVFG